MVFCGSFSAAQVVFVNLSGLARSVDRIGYFDHYVTQAQHVFTMAKSRSVTRSAPAITKQQLTHRPAVVSFRGYRRPVGQQQAREMNQRQRA
jgi:hypothetical protein